MLLEKSMAQQASGKAYREKVSIFRLYDMFPDAEIRDWLPEE